MKRKSIIQRWLVRTMLIILSVLIGVLVVASFSIKKQYYNNVEKTMESSLSPFRDKFFAGQVEDKERNDPEYYSRVRREIERFSNKERMELMGIDADGNVLITSSGFPANYPNVGSELDFLEAMASDKGISGFYMQEMEGEEVMVMSLRLPRVTSGQPSLLRAVVSLDLINAQIIYILGIITLLIMLIIVLIAYSNSYFISSLVFPLREVSDVARKIALGDFTERVQVKSSDEIGQLAETINYMAGELAESEQMKNEFISSVSHELRTPLTAIRGWAETISFSEEMTEPEIEMSKRGMSVILGETERLGQMVEELLDFSRMQSGRFTMAFERMDILVEVEDVYLLFQERAVREGVSLKLDVDETSDYFVMGDKNRLKQVFVNLIDNAFKYTDKDGSITLKLMKENDTVCVQIIDTGAGIDEKDLPQVKTRFYKGKGARRGSGIGLSVVDEIVTRHLGTFEIDSILHIGTTITLLFPIYERFLKEELLHEKETEKEMKHGERKV